MSETSANRRKRYLEKKNKGTLKPQKSRKNELNNLFPVGSFVLKKFPPLGLFVGRVVEIHTYAHRGRSHRILYSDGDSEDVSVAELTQLKELEGGVSVEQVQKYWSDVKREGLEQGKYIQDIPPVVDSSSSSSSEDDEDEDEDSGIRASSSSKTNPKSKKSTSTSISISTSTSTSTSSTKIRPHCNWCNTRFTTGQGLGGHLSAHRCEPDWPKMPKSFDPSRVLKQVDLHPSTVAQYIKNGRMEKMKGKGMDLGKGEKKRRPDSDFLEMLKSA